MVGGGEKPGDLSEELVFREMGGEASRALYRLKVIEGINFDLSCTGSTCFFNNSKLC